MRRPGDTQRRAAVFPPCRIRRGWRRTQGASIRSFNWRKRNSMFRDATGPREPRPQVARKTSGSHSPGHVIARSSGEPSAASAASSKSLCRLVSGRTGLPSPRPQSVTWSRPSAPASGMSVPLSRSTVAGKRPSARRVRRMQRRFRSARPDGCTDSSTGGREPHGACADGRERVARALGRAPDRAERGWCASVRAPSHGPMDGPRPRLAPRSHGSRAGPSTPCSARVSVRGSTGHEC